MKRELIAAILLLLLAALAVWNVTALNARCAALDALVAEAQACAETDAPAAQALLDRAQADWDAMDIYARATLPHDDVDAVTEALEAARAALKTDADDVLSSLRLLRARLAALAGRERATLGNIL